MYILCENIRAYRKERGLTQKELAERLGISDKTVSRWESGVQLPEASLIPQIADALGVTIDALYGIEKEVDGIAESGERDEKKSVVRFKVTVVAGALFSLLGSLLYRYFGSAVFLSPRVVDLDYYNTTKGATADIFAFVGIAAVFAGILAVVIAKVRFAMRFKQMSDPIFAVNVRYTGAAIIVYSVILMKTVPEILSFGFYLPREVYGWIFVAALTAVLLWYRRELKRRETRLSKAVAVISLIGGGVGAALSAGAFILRDYIAVWVSVNDTEIYNRLSLVMTVMLAVGELLLLAMPVILYIELLIRLRKV